MEPGLEALGQALREHQRTAAPAFDQAAQKARFLAGARQRPTSSRRSSIALASLAAAALVLGMVLRSPGRVTFEVAGRAGREAQWLVAPAVGSLPLSFSEGSQVVLFDQARARVVDTSPRGACVVLEHGRLRADVVHRQGTTWRVEAGPFVVHVVGTRFQVSWDAVRERFQLDLEQGSVRVVGPSLGRGRVLVPGERLELGLGELHRQARPQPTLLQLAPQSTKQADPPLPRPRALRVATAGARADEVEALLRKADAARFSGQPVQAAATLRALRQRFPAHPGATDAAFLLGRLSFDQLAAPADAARWFSVYLEQAPHGSFAPEALGRMIECYVRLQRDAVARQIAERYLAQYPQGPHARIAHDTLGRR